MENEKQYKLATEKHDWSTICDLNGVKFDNFGTLKELKVLPQYLEQGEVVFALTSGLMGQGETSNSVDLGWNTWLLVLTNERFLLLDHALMSTSVDTQSVRLDRVQAVSASQGWMFGKVSIDIGNRMIVVDNCAKDSVRCIAELANKLIKEHSATSSNPSAKSTSSPLEELKSLAELKNSGILTDVEFEEAKKRILAKF